MLVILSRPESSGSEMRAAKDLESVSEPMQPEREIALSRSFAFDRGKKHAVASSG